MEPKTGKRIIEAESRIAILASTLAMIAMIVFPLTIFINPDALFSWLYWAGVGLLVLLCSVYVWREDFYKK